MSVFGNFLKQNFQCYKDIAIKNADSLQILKEFPKNSVDCIITEYPRPKGRGFTAQDKN